MPDTNEYMEGIHPSGGGFNVSLATSAASITIEKHRYIKTDTAETLTVRMALDGSKVSLPVVAGVNPEQISVLFSPNGHSGSTICFLK